MSLIRPACPAELDWLVDQAAAAGWNPGLSDAQLFWQLDPAGFLAIDVQGEFAGGGAVVRHSDNYGFMGLFIMHPEHRGKGYGRTLWLARRDYLLSRLAVSAAIGLDAVDAMVPFYSRGGFQPETRHRRFCWEPSVATAGMAHASVSGALPAGVHWLPVEEITAGSVAEIDRCCFPADRLTFLHTWLTQPACVVVGLAKHGRPCGYGVARRCVSGCKIGPLFAETAELAAALLLKFRHILSDVPLFIDVPDTNPAAVALCRQFGMREVFGCIRMYLGAPPQVRNSYVFGITTLEVG